MQHRTILDRIVETDGIYPSIGFALSITSFQPFIFIHDMDRSNLTTLNKLSFLGMSSSHGIELSSHVFKWLKMICNHRQVGIWLAGEYLAAFSWRTCHFKGWSDCKTIGPAGSHKVVLMPLLFVLWSSKWNITERRMRWDTEQ